MRLAREAVHKAGVSKSELEPNDLHKSIDIPDDKLFTSKSGREPLFIGGKYYVYVFAVLKYRDQDTEAG
jgi:hypothetical protein